MWFSKLIHTDLSVAFGPSQKPPKQRNNPLQQKEEGPKKMTIEITTEVASIAQIETRAREAAQMYDSLIDACPYPLHSTSARVFAQAFEQARAEAPQSLA